MSEENNEKKLDAMTEAPLRFGEITLRPFSAGSMRLLHRIKSPFTGADNGRLADMTPMEICDHVGNFIFIHAADLDFVLSAIGSGKFEDEVVHWLVNNHITAGQIVAAAPLVVKAIESGMIGLDYQVESKEGGGPN